MKIKEWLTLDNLIKEEEILMKNAKDSIKYNIAKACRDYFVELKQRREQIGFNDYQQSAMRTANKECKNIANFGLGLVGEAGEVVEVIKKHLFHGHELDKDKLVKEMGDCVWYLALGCEILDVSLEEVINKNINKLKERYPNGFSFDKSINRKEVEYDAN
jgi:NTP pyrophosphatase (non-canonical NTP hydrolase)